jgi:hypothetical protein
MAAVAGDFDFVAGGITEVAPEELSHLDIEPHKIALSIHEHVGKAVGEHRDAQHPNGAGLLQSFEWFRISDFVLRVSPPLRSASQMF